MEQILSLAGAALVLGAFVGLQLGRLATIHRGYQLANLVGAALLAGAGLVTQTWGFVALNVVWAGFAGFKLAQLVLTPQRSRSTAADPPST